MNLKTKKKRAKTNYIETIENEKLEKHTNKDKHFLFCQKKM